MSQASDYAAALPEVPAKIRDRFVPYRAVEIEEHLRPFEHLRPGLFDAMVRMIDILEADSSIENTSVDFDEEGGLMPVTIWADSTFPLEQREENLVRIHHIAKDTLRYFNDLVLVAVM